MSTPAVKIWPDSAFPKRLVDDSRVHGGLRHVELGEEGETWVFLGHPYHPEVIAAIEAIGIADDFGWDTDDLPDAATLQYTYARFEKAGPDQPVNGWYLDWSDGGEDGKANRAAAGYFPVVVWRADL